MSINEPSGPDRTYLVRLFAVLRDRQGASTIEVSGVEVPIRAAALLARIATDHTALAGLVGVSRLAANEEFVAPDAWVFPDQRLALLPPVAGG